MAEYVIKLPDVGEGVARPSSLSGMCSPAISSRRTRSSRR